MWTLCALAVFAAAEATGAGAEVVARDERVAEEVLVVPVGIVVGPRVRAAALAAGQACDDHALGEVEQETELERLRQVAVEDVALVVDDDALVALLQRGHDLP